MVVTEAEPHPKLLKSPMRSSREPHDINHLSLDDVYAARQRLVGVAHRTPLEHNKTFSDIAGCAVYLKMENMQKTGSYKIRGAFNKIQSLSEEEKAKGVIAASAGNHGQGVAYAASAAAIRSLVVMPETSPLAKIAATRGYGAQVILHGLNYDESYRKAKEIEVAEGMTYIHAFNDAQVVAGQGTVGLEILEDLPDVTTVVVPIGGGGLISGLSFAMKQLKASVRIVGVQTDSAPAMYSSHNSHHLTTKLARPTIADGIAVSTPGDLTFDFVQDYVDEIVLVDDESIAATMLLLLERAKLVVEGAGATALAALLHGKISGIKGGKVVCVLGGGNVDINLISKIIERGMVKAGRRVRIEFDLSDRPGELSRVLSIISDMRANVLQVIHERSDRKVAIGRALVDISLEVQDRQHADEVVAQLQANGIDTSIM